MNKENEKKMYKRLEAMPSEVESEFTDYLKELEHLDVLEEMHPAAKGSILSAISEGTNHLSDKQLKSITWGLNEHYYTHECAMCLEEIKWNEMSEANDTGKCSSCNYKLRKEGIDL